MRFKLVPVIYWVLITPLLACGKATSPAADSGNSAGGGSSGAGGSAAGVPCGATVCKAPTGFTGELCCQDAFASVCGQKARAEQCVVFPGPGDPNCPDGTLAQSIGAMLVRGCCDTDTDQCGLDLSGLGAGAGTYCSSLSNVDIFSDPPPAGSKATTYIPPPTNCDGTRSM